MNQIVVTREEAINLLVEDLIYVDSDEGKNTHRISHLKNILQVGFRGFMKFSNQALQDELDVTFGSKYIID